MIFLNLFQDLQKIIYFETDYKNMKTENKKIRAFSLN